MTTAVTDGRPLFHLLAWAVALWIASALLFIVWFFASTPDPGLAAVGVPLVAWAIGYVPGGLGLMTLGAIQALRGRLPASVAAWAAAVYFLPAILVGLTVQIPRWLAPLTSSEADLAGLTGAAIGPFLVVLYLAGLAWGWAVRERPLRRTVKAVVSPPLVGLALAGLWSAATVLRSPEARARGSMQFAIERVEMTASRVEADAVFTLARQGTYRYSAVYLQTAAGTSGGRATAIEWPDGVPSGPGRYRCRLIFGDVVVHPVVESRVIIFEVRTDAGEDYGAPVAEFRIPIVNNGM